jgi:hypothetical protein
MENIIDEMALIMCGREGCKTCTHFIDATKCAAVVSAKKLYNAGYRKQEWISIDDRLPENGLKERIEVAREIFEEIERLLREHSDWEILCDGKSLWYYEESIGADIAELKKKYQEGEPNGSK